jgi:hypothetical protein
MVLREQVGTSKAIISIDMALFTKDDPLPHDSRHN